MSGDGTHTTHRMFPMYCIRLPRPKKYPPANPRTIKNEILCAHLGAARTKCGPENCRSENFTVQRSRCGELPRTPNGCYNGDALTCEREADHDAERGTAGVHEKMGRKLGPHQMDAAHSQKDRHWDGTSRGRRPDELWRTFEEAAPGSSTGVIFPRSALRE